MWRLAILELKYFPKVLQRGFIIYLPLLGLPVLSYYIDQIRVFTNDLDNHNLSFYPIYILPLVLRAIVLFLPYIYPMFMIHYIIVTLRRDPNKNNLLLPISVRQSGLVSPVFTLMTYVIFIAAYFLFMVLFKWSVAILPTEAQHVVDDAYIPALISYAAAIMSIVYAITSLGEKYSKILSYMYFSFFVFGTIFLSEMHKDVITDVYYLIISDFIATIPGALLISFIFCSAYYFSFTNRRSYV